MSIAKYFIKKGTDSTKDLYSVYGLYILESKGIWDLPSKKEAYIENWYDKNGQKVYEPVDNIFQPVSSNIKFAAIGDINTVKQNIRDFYSYITSVVPVANGFVYGSSSFYIWNEIWGESNRKEIRCTGFETGSKLSYQDVLDIQNPNEKVSAYTFSLNFIIDKPTI